jgi:hypothetical protein
MHLMLGSAADVPGLRRLIAEQLAPMGVNVLVLEVDYNFRLQSHPEIGGDVTKADAREVAAVCREHGIRVIPLLNCLGHQSWGKDVGGLLRAHPELEEAPDISMDDPAFYCQSWCPLHPDVNPIVLDLMDELLDAFQADALHVGMDEVFIIGSEKCPRCKGKPTAELFAKAVNDYHAHLVGERGVEMLMWGDRLLDAATSGYGMWEAAANGTAPAIDMVPKDIIMCDWHYEVLDGYPSLKLFQEKGFRVWPCPWRDPEAARRLIAAAKDGATEKMLGMCGTGWGAGGGGSALAKVLAGEVKPDEEAGMKDAIGTAAVLRAAVEAFTD